MNNEVSFRRVSRPSLQYKSQCLTLQQIKRPNLADKLCAKCQALFQPILAFYDNQLYRTATVQRSQSQQIKKRDVLPETQYLQQISQLESQIRQLKMPAEFHRNIVSQYRSRINELQRELDKADQTCKIRLLQQEQQLNQVLAKAFTENEAVQSQNLELRQSVDYANVRNHVLQAENAQLQAQCRSSCESEQSSARQIQWLQHENEALREKCDQQRSAIEQLEKKSLHAQQQQTERLDLTREVTTLKQSIEDLHVQLAGETSKCDGLETLLRREQIKNEGLRDHISQLESKITQIQSECDLASGQISNCARFNQNMLPSKQMDASFAYEFPQNDSDEGEMVMARILTEEEVQFVDAYCEALKYQPDLRIFDALPREAVKYGFEKVQNDCFNSNILIKCGVSPGIARNAELDDFACRRASGNYMFLNSRFDGFQCSYFTPAQSRVAAEIIYAGFQIRDARGDVFLQRDGEVLFL